MAFGIQRQLGVDQLSAAVTVGQKAGRALVGPLHRAAERLGRMQDTDIFGIADILHAEGAADIGGENADLVVRHVEDLGQRRLVAGNALRGHLQRVALGLVVVMRQRHARLHRDDSHAGVDDVEPGHMRRLGEGRLDPGGVAIVIVERDIVRDVIVKLRCAGFCRFGRAGDGRKGLDVNLDCFCCIARPRQRFRHHDGNGIADEAHLVDGKRRPVGLQERRAVAALQRQAAAEGIVVGGGEVGTGPHPEHARHCLGGLGVDALDDAVGMAGTDDPGVGLVGQAEVVSVLALAANQDVVLLAEHRLADAIFLQCDSVLDGRLRRLILH